MWSALLWEAVAASFGAFGAPLGIMRMLALASIPYRRARGVGVAPWGFAIDRTSLR